MKRTVEISTRGSKLHLENSRLTIDQDNQIVARIPVEDIGALVLETSGISISSGLLGALAGAGGVILSCDDTHHPNGIFMPIVANSLHGERIRFQVDAPISLLKNLWARTIKAKIKNQAHLIVRTPEHKRLIHLANKVRSGDTGNVEAQASRFYWSALFSNKNPEHDSFRRRRHGPPPNNLLNYGYAILRAATARALCAAGLHPGLGIHHRNKYNGYCLADDIMEPFRPWIDLTAKKLFIEENIELNKETKRRLLETLTMTVKIRNEHSPLLVALEITASSLVKVFSAVANNGLPAPQAAKQFYLPKIPTEICAE